MKKSLIFLILIIFFITGCSNIVDYSVDLINVTNTSSPKEVDFWINSIKRDNGIYLAKLKNQKGKLDYYLYINNLNKINNLYKEYSNVKLGTVKSDGIEISIELKEGNQSNNMLFLIRTGKKPKYFLLNNQKLPSDSIKLLD